MFKNEVRGEIIKNTVDRRQHPRVKYPRAGQTHLPHVISSKGIFYPSDMSLGGMLLKNPPIAKPKPKSKYGFKMIFPPSKTELFCEAELIRVSGESWHFKWTKLDEKFNVEFVAAFKAGLRGYQLRVFDAHDIPPGKDIVELWLSEQGDLVMFQQPDATGPYQVTVTCGNHRSVFASGHGFMLATRKDQNHEWVYSQPAPSHIAEEFLLMIANIRNPTLKICKLQSDVESIFSGKAPIR